MSAIADRPDDEGTPLHHNCRCHLHGPRDFIATDSFGRTTRTVLKTTASIRANRAIIREVFGCPDGLVEETLEHAAKHVDDPYE